MNRFALCTLIAPTGSWPRAAWAGAPDPAAAIERAMAAAETRLREGELQAAESHYREALLEGWLLMGTLARVEGRPLDARAAFRRASTSAFENRLALQALALAHLQLGEAAPAVETLRRLARSSPGDIQTRRFLAQALTAGGQPEDRCASWRTRERWRPGTRSSRSPWPPGTWERSRSTRRRASSRRSPSTARSRRPASSSAAPIGTSGSTSARGPSCGRRCSRTPACAGRTTTSAT